jgi:ABC-type transporter Mla subunit MlaD
MTPPKNRKTQMAVLVGLITFALALCALVVVMMLRRGPAVAY